MTFADNAARLSGQIAALLGWRPAEFWAATPAEIEHVLAAMIPQTETPPDAGDRQKLMEQFPDG
jgi:hypothetical protein